MTKGTGAFNMKALRSALQTTKTLKKTLTKHEKDLKSMISKDQERKKRTLAKVQGIHSAFANLLVNHENEIEKIHKSVSRPCRPAKSRNPEFSAKQAAELSKLIEKLSTK